MLFQKYRQALVEIDSDRVEPGPNFQISKRAGPGPGREILASSDL